MLIYSRCLSIETARLRCWEYPLNEIVVPLYLVIRKPHNLLVAIIQTSSSSRKKRNNNRSSTSAWLENGCSVALVETIILSLLSLRCPYRLPNNADSFPKTFISLIFNTPKIQLIPNTCKKLLGPPRSFMYFLLGVCRSFSKTRWYTPSLMNLVRLLKNFVTWALLCEW